MLGSKRIPLYVVIEKNFQLKRMKATHDLTLMRNLKKTIYFIYFDKLQHKLFYNLKRTTKL